MYINKFRFCEIYLIRKIRGIETQDFYHCCQSHQNRSIDCWQQLFHNIGMAVTEVMLTETNCFGSMIEMQEELGKSLSPVAPHIEIY